MLGGFFGGKNGINANYSFSSTPTFSSEPWTVYTGKPKSSSKYTNFEKCSVFVFDKKKYEQYMSKNGLVTSSNKEYIQEAYALLKKQVSNLTKLKHPNILQIIEPLEEHSKNFLFVTEYVSGSVDTVYRKDNYNSMYNGSNQQSSMSGNILDGGIDGDDSTNNNVLFQRGLLQIAKGLDFIHNTAKSVVLDLQPNNIFINENGDWKLGGLMHLCKLPTGSDNSDFLLDNNGESHPRLPPFLHIPYNYTAPEVILDNHLSCKNDYFSLGCLLYFLYYGDALFNCENSAHYYKQEYAKFEKKLTQLGWDRVFPKITNERLSVLLPRLMNRDLYARFDNIQDLYDQDFCKDPLITTLVFLDDFPTKKIDEKKAFLQGLIEYLPKFPKQISQKSILPHLIDVLELGYNVKSDHAELIPVVLELILIIGSQFSQLSFNEKIYSHLRIQELINNDASIVLFKYLSILQQKVKKDDFIDKILKPLLTATMDTNNNNNNNTNTGKLIETQEWCLKTEIVDLVLSTFDFITIKNFYFPLISKTFIMTTSLNIKISCAKCFHSMISKKSIEKYQAMDDIMPLFAGMKTRDQKMLLTCLPIFVKISDLYMDEEAVIVQKILPLAWNFSMADTLSLSNYRKYNQVINTISLKVQQNHEAKVQKIESRNISVSNKSESEIFENMINQTASEMTAVKTDSDKLESKKIVSVAPIKPISKKTVTTTQPSTTGQYPTRFDINSGPAKVQEQTKRTPLVALNPKPKPRTTPVPKSSYNYFKDENPSSTTASDDFDDFVQAKPSIPTSQTRFTAPSTVQTTPNTLHMPSTSTTSLPLQPSSKSSTPQPPGFSMSLLQPSARNNKTQSNSSSLI
ncbi:hypothetical protein ACO0QE_003542 [Hanseniaspora vineae]